MLRDGGRTISRSAEDCPDISFGLRFLESSRQEGRCSRRQFRPLRFPHCHVGNQAHKLLVPGAGPTTITSNQVVTHIDRLLFSLRRPRFHHWRSLAVSWVHVAVPRVVFSIKQHSRCIRDKRESQHHAILPSSPLRSFQFLSRRSAITPVTTLKVSPNTQSGLSFCFWGLFQLEITASCE